jgi:hypothetical protein
VALIATATLVVSLIVAATAVSIEMARADTLGRLADGDGSGLAIAIMLGFVTIATGSLTVAATRRRR